MSQEKFNEKQLVELLKRPETRRKAFEIVVRQYSETLYWKVRRMVLTHDDADDVMQNVMLKAWTNIDSFQQQSLLSTWLYRIAINESLNFIRSQRNKAVNIDADKQAELADRLMADPYFDGDETAAQLQQAITSLPDVQRTVFNLRYYDNMKYSEMSQLLDTTEGALKASYHIAVKKITEFFNQKDYTFCAIIRQTKKRNNERREIYTPANERKTTFQSARRIFRRFGNENHDKSTRC